MIIQLIEEEPFAKFGNTGQEGNWAIVTLQVVLFRHILPQPTQAQLMRGEFPETLCIVQGAVLYCRFAEWMVRCTSRVLWMAVVGQSSENSSRQENRDLPCREQHTIPQVSQHLHQPLRHNYFIPVAMQKTLLQ